MPGHVLYIEDDDSLRELFAESIRGAGLIVAEEKYAESALETLKHMVPDVVLLDLGMPAGQMSGIEVLARIRQVPAWAHIPVVVFSGFGDVVNPDVMARLNVAYVLSKASVHGDELARLLGDIVRRGGDGNASAAETAPP